MVTATSVIASAISATTARISTSVKPRAVRDEFVMAGAGTGNVPALPLTRW